MPMSKRMARFNQLVTNRTIGRCAPWLPGFGVVHHVGRTSGRAYHTPVNVFRRGDGFVMALTYSSTADWVKNVRAAGGCELVNRRRRYRLVDPELVVDPTRRAIKGPARLILRLAGVDEFLRLTIGPG
ncbi:MAG TPA: nitroreductase family deazaflavin-dependent oxidoreductase [Acidimicrobiales bacterium]|nr:nitroreductase family deazaflavin-dependent oxidoreductase [Acidimicrobiales bacterium]